MSLWQQMTCHVKTKAYMDLFHLPWTLSKVLIQLIFVISIKNQAKRSNYWWNILILSLQYHTNILVLNAWTLLHLITKEKCIRCFIFLRMIKDLSQRSKNKSKAWKCCLKKRFKSFVRMKQTSNFMWSIITYTQICKNTQTMTNIYIGSTKHLERDLGHHQFRFVYQIFLNPWPWIGTFSVSLQILSILSILSSIILKSQFTITQTLSANLLGTLDLVTKFTYLRIKQDQTILLRQQ